MNLHRTHLWEPMRARNGRRDQEESQNFIDQRKRDELHTVLEHPVHGAEGNQPTEVVLRVANVNNKPIGALARVKDTPLGRFYVRRIKKYAVMRHVALLLWRYGYPIYANHVAGFLLSRKKRRWSPIINLDHAAQSMKLNRRDFCGPQRVATPAPLVWPAHEQAYLKSPHEGYEFPSLYTVIVHDATVYGGTNLVFVKGLAICHDLYHFESDYTSEELHGLHLIDPGVPKLRCQVQDDEPVVLSEAAVFVDACAPNYAHWLTEVLPRVAFFCSTPESHGVAVVVNDGLHRNLMESLMLVAGTLRPIVTLPVGRAIRVEKLHLTSVAGYVPFDRRGPVREGFSHGKFSPVAFGLLRDTLHSLIKGEDDTGWPEKVYLRRNSGIRKVTNSDELECILVGKGFVVVAPENLTFLDQVRLFSRAKVIVGSSGAALANLVFARKDARICILISKYTNTSYWYWQNMACASGGLVRYILGAIENVSAGIHADFSVSSEEVLRAFEC